VKKEHPRLVGIQVHGSVARGEPGPFSDIDLLGVYDHGKKPHDFSYFDRGIYVGVGFLTVSALRKKFSDAKSFFWGRGSADNTRILYDPKGVLKRLVVRWKGAKPSRGLIENSLWEAYHNIVEYSGKLRNGWVGHDEYLTRYSASIIAVHVERALVALNDISIISENYLWHQILRAKKKPQHLRIDYPLARGLQGSQDLLRIFRAALRLCKETLRLVKTEYVRNARNKQFRGFWVRIWRSTDCENLTCLKSIWEDVRDKVTRRSWVIVTSGASELRLKFSQRAYFLFGLCPRRFACFVAVVITPPFVFRPRMCLHCCHVELTTCRYRSSDKSSVLFSTNFFIRCTRQYKM